MENLSNDGEKTVKLSINAELHAHTKMTWEGQVDAAKSFDTLRKTVRSSRRTLGNGHRSSLRAAKRALKQADRFMQEPGRNGFGAVACTAEKVKAN